MPNPGLMADHLADLLGISKDSVYRRIKGEKPCYLKRSLQLPELFIFL